MSIEYERLGSFTRVYLVAGGTRWYIGCWRTPLSFYERDDYE